MLIHLSPSSIDDYTMFLRIKGLPKYRLVGRSAIVPDEYAAQLGIGAKAGADDEYRPPEWMFDYQAAIAKIAVRKRKFCVFADCGLGKTAILIDFAKHAARNGGRVLIVSPLMVVRQTVAEAERFYGGSVNLAVLRASELHEWMQSGTGIGITNYEAITDDLPQTPLDGLILDESSMLKSHYGAWGLRLLEMGRGVPYKLCLTGTPAPNDRIEYANHAVFMDAYPTVNAFLARFFVNRGQTNERWELKKHALGSFYRALSHWCIFLTDPKVYGWHDNTETLPPIHVHIHDVPLTDTQRTEFMDHEGALFCDGVGGIGSRGRIARIAKGIGVCGRAIPTNKITAITGLIDSWPDESTIVWCKYNQEQDSVAAEIPGCGNIDGSTPIAERQRIIDGFKAGTIRTIVTKPKILGFGLNLQKATRQVFSTLQDSYEEYYQAVKRSNRYGSTQPLNVHIPVTELEAPMIETVLRKAHRVAQDTREQEEMFREHSWQQ
jgi:superfamily II DNA or RNA helicase